MLNRTTFTITQLEYIIAVHRHGHFGKAAEACMVTQPTLSMQIQKLEEDLGVVIFDRSKKPVLLTDIGKKLIEQIQTALFEAKKITSLVESSKADTTQGLLIVGVIPTIAPYLLPKLLKVLETHYAQIELKILELQTHRIIEALNNDEIDVGILATPLKIPRILEKPLYYEPFSVLCHKNHELSRMKRIKSTSLDTQDIWLLQEGHCLRNQVLDFCAIKSSQPHKRKYNFESGSLETLKNIVETYGGYTLLPEMATESLSRNTQLIPFERPIPAREVGLVYRREHYKTALLDALSESILKCIPEHVRKIRPKDLEVLPVE